MVSNEINILNKNELLQEYRKRGNLTFRKFSLLLKESDFLLPKKNIESLNNLLTENYKETLNYFDRIFNQYGDNSFYYVLNIESEEEKILEIQSLAVNMVMSKLGSHMSSFMQATDKSKKHIHTRDFTFNKNEFNDFICLSLQHKQFNDESMNEFINLINKIKQFNDTQKEILRKYLSYTNILHLSYFCFIVSNFINSIEFKEKLPNNSQKRGYFYTYFVEFLNVLDNETISNLAKGYLNINLKDSNAVKKDKIFQEEKKSHYIQGAYLKRVIGEKMKFFNADKPVIKGVKDPDLDNPYCILFIYGTTIDDKEIKSIENELAGGIECYFNDFLDYIQNNNIQTSPSFKMGNKVKLYQELNLYLLLNYARTPSLLEDLFLSFNIFLHQKGSYFFKGNPEKSSEELIKTPNPLESQKIFKELQLIIIQLILDGIKHKNLMKSHDLLANILIRINNSSYLREFLVLVVNKLSVFLNTYWEYEILDKEIKYFSDNLFILHSRMNKELFETSDNISLAYFPINKNKILFLKNKKQYSKELFNYVINQENIMLANKRNKFIVEPF